MRVLSAVLVSFVFSLAPTIEAHAAAKTVSAHVRLAVSNADGVVSIEELRPGAPPVLVLEWVDAACGFDAAPEVYLNDVRLAQASVEAADPAGCAPRLRTARIDDADAIASAWRAGGDNVVRVTSLAGAAAVAWARVRLGDGLASPFTCVFDAGAGGCDAIPEGVSDSARGAFDVGATLPRGRGAVRRLEVPFSRVLPRQVDIADLADGRHAVCVASSGSTTCTEFEHQGEVELRLDGSAQPLQVPVAIIAAGQPVQCSSPLGGVVNLDGSASTGDIATYEWFESFGTRGEVLLGTGAQLSVTLPLGAHAVTLRVTDAAGQVAAAQASRTVIDTVAPQMRMIMSPWNLWPLDHRMVPVTAEPEMYDACGDPSLVLLSLTSTEPDDAPGELDGVTTQDIQDAVPGTADRSFLLRAETGTTFGGRRYLVTYVAVDAGGNRTIWRGAVGVRPPLRRQLFDDKRELQLQ